MNNASYLNRLGEAVIKREQLWVAHERYSQLYAKMLWLPYTSPKQEASFLMYTNFFLSFLSGKRSSNQTNKYRTCTIKSRRHYSKIMFWTLRQSHKNVMKDFFLLETLWGGHLSRAAFNGAGTVLFCQVSCWRKQLCTFQLQLIIKPVLFILVHTLDCKWYNARVSM